MLIFLKNSFVFCYNFEFTFLYPVAKMWFLVLEQNTADLVPVQWRVQ